MDLFHNHVFMPMEANPKILYCICGQMKHTCEWENESNIYNSRDEIIGRMLKCKICGNLKNHVANY